MVAAIRAVAVLLAIGSLIVAGVSGGSAGASSSTVVTLDEHDGIYPLEDVAQQVKDGCAQTDHLTIKVMTRVARFATKFDCIDARAQTTDTISTQLVATAARQNDARKRADRVVAIDHALPVADQVGYERDSMIWSFAAGLSGRCERADRVNEIRADMASAARASNETPVRWTIIEAVRIAGACPEQLPVLFRSVSKVGQPEAAEEVARVIHRVSRHATSR
jgi:hypothetical protein